MHEEGESKGLAGDLAMRKLQVHELALEPASLTAAA
jgi:hypothetical protein